MGIFGRGGSGGRERRAMRKHLEELDDLRRKNLGELGRMTVEMSREGSFDRRLFTKELIKARRWLGQHDQLVAQRAEEGDVLDAQRRRPLPEDADATQRCVVAKDCRAEERLHLRQLE